MPLNIGDAVPPIQVPAYTPGRRNARITGPADHRGRWVVLAFQPRTEAVRAFWLDALAALAGEYTSEAPVILAASTATWLEQAARHVDDRSLEGRVAHILADGQQRLAAACGVLQEDGDCRPAAIVIDPAGRVRHVSTGARQPLARAA
ncbi:MAG TPA: redoxin domain-containing protein [Solirubrobacteraceae bacterium]|nr:redoxin domain-containing protein [Solirubrobacteraceae bacterium]